MKNLNSPQSKISKKPVHFLPNVPFNEADLPATKSATEETIDRLKYGTAAYSLGMNSNGESVNKNGDALSSEDANFKAELEYDGYDDIEEYDNDAYSANVDQKPDTTQALNFSGRTELPTGEESPVDVQENKKPV